MLVVGKVFFNIVNVELEINIFLEWIDIYVKIVILIIRGSWGGLGWSELNIKI